MTPIQQLTQEVNRWLEMNATLSEELRGRIRRELKWKIGIPSQVGMYWFQSMEYQGLSFGPQMLHYSVIRELAQVIPEKLCLYDGPIYPQKPLPREQR